MEHAVIGCLHADSSSEANFHTEARPSLPAAESFQSSETSGNACIVTASDGGPARHGLHVSPARLATAIQRGKGGTPRAARGKDLRQTRVLMQALCEMRLEFCKPDEDMSAAALETRQATTMALWNSRERALFTQPDVERGIEARLEAGFRHARNGSPREAAGEFKRAYLLLCCALTHARDIARRKAQAGQSAGPM
ncbi:hypothetical protein EPAKOI_004291 [Cupriavidus sp. H18C2]